MAALMAATCSSPMRSCTDAWPRPMRKKIEPKMRADDRDDAARATLVALSRVT